MALPKIREQIEARVQDTGDTMTDNLIIKRNTYPGVALDALSTGTRTSLQGWDNSAVLVNFNISGNTDNRRALFIKNSNGATQIKNALTLRDWVDGAATEYKIYGEHNKPTPADIGAATASHVHSQYYTSDMDRAANTILAAPNGSAGSATFRKLVSADIPDLSGTYLKLSGGTMTGTLYGTNIVPTTAGTGAIGMSGTPWLNIHSQYFRVYDPNNVQTGFLDAPIAGTTSTQGETYLAIGNATASGSNGNSRGRVRMYGTSSGYIDLYPTASTSNFTIALPAASGTVALTGHTHAAGDITSGTLAVARGGTGQITAKNAANAFMNALETGSSTPVDADYYISQYVNGGTTTTTYHRRPMSALWSYINGKVSASYPTKTGGGASGTWGISIGGNAKGISSSGYGNGNLTYLQTSGDFNGATGWSHYLIANHGDGATYYNYTLALPFWGPPTYKRQTGSTSNITSWYTMYSTENITSGTSALTSGSSGLTSDYIYLQYK